MHAASRLHLDHYVTLSRDLQIASALCHLHELQPDSPHGHVTPRCIFVTSANEVCLGRALSSASLVGTDPCPSPKRRNTDTPQVSDSNASPVSSPDPRCLVQLAHCSIDSCRESMSHRLDGTTHCMTGSPLDGTNPCTHSGRSSAELRGAMSSHLDHSCGRCQGSLSGMKQISDQRTRWSIDGDKCRSSIVSNTDVQGLGCVTKVSMPSRNQSTRQSLYEVAEAAVWSRSGVLPSRHLFPAVCDANTGSGAVSVKLCTETSARKTPFSMPQNLGHSNGRAGRAAGT
jgi:hypothetical protein